ncbi:MAG TPA: DUF1698 domain-containing protein [Flavobacteriales bacterium]
MNLHFHSSPCTLIAALILGLMACDQPTKDPATQVPANSTPGNATGPDAAGEDDWRSADSLIAVLGGVQGKVVADLGAGDGYYTWHLLKAGAKVIAVDEDANHIAALEARKKELAIGDDRLLIRMVSPGTTGLQPGEADIALITRPYSSIPDRANFIGQLRMGTRAPHVTAFVDFLQQQTPVGPPMDERVHPDQVMDELGVMGYHDVVSLTKKMPYRFLVVAQDLPAEAM